MRENGWVMVLPLIGAAAALLVSVFGLRHLLRWAARRGWIYYGKDRPPPGAGGMALMEWAANFEPEIEYVIEEQRSGDLHLVHEETGEVVDMPDGSPIENDHTI